MVAGNEIIPAASKIVGIGDRKRGFGGGYQPNDFNRKKDRRKTPYDRRKSVREGVIVILSCKKERRMIPDRRFPASGRPVPTKESKSSDYDIIA